MPTAPEIIGHRGAPREAPENTLPAFRRAIELGADAVELDVHATADGVAVVHHDPVPRVQSAPRGLAHRPISELTWEELREFRLDKDAAIPTLAEVLDDLPARARIYVEVKAPAADAPVIALVRQHGIRCAVHSFDHRVTRRLRRAAPDIRGGILLSSYLIDTGAAMRGAGALDLWQHWEFIDEPLVAEVHAAGGRIIAWTVNDVRLARSFVAMGVDAICSDVPGEMRRALAS
jgi:glycerophosphoryl diester phosphodiesterase